MYCLKLIFFIYNYVPGDARWQQILNENPITFPWLYKSYTTEEKIEK
jgi:hypothetical protein